MLLQPATCLQHLECKMQACYIQDDGWLGRSVLTHAGVWLPEFTEVLQKPHAGLTHIAVGGDTLLPDPDHEQFHV